MASNVSGIFFHLSDTKNRMKDYSRKWWLAVVSLAAFTLALVSVLIGLALTANSGLGLPVVVGTFVIAFSMLLVWYVFKIRYSSNQMFDRKTYLRLAGSFLILATAVLPVSLLTSPSNPIGFWQAVVTGAITLSVMLFLIYEGYPRLKDYGSPGILATAGLLIVFALVYMTLISDWIIPYNPFSINVGDLREPPNPDFPLGTTSLGQDMLSRVIAGGATMLQVAVLSVVVCFSIGVPVGLFSSYRGGNLDKGIGLLMDSIFAFPGLVLAIAISAMLGPGVVNMAIAIAVVYIPSYFRIVRSQVMTIKELPYVEAAIVMGAKDRYILLRYILPNVLPSSIIIMSINFADAILTAAGLTFVGLGLPVDIADWGWDLTLGFDVLIIGAWWISTFPGIMIVLLALGFTLTGDGLNEILTPKLRE
ncbi:MAG: ABC transporter permease [Candidatus Thorarchaeota archaeon]|nr:ABC transporter permease [Candidatus Thorarchaeota archaeon]